MSSDDQRGEPAPYIQASDLPGWLVSGGPAGATGALILRAWREPPGTGSLRIRILARQDVTKAVEGGMTTGSIDEAAEFVRAWLAGFRADGGPVTKR